MVIIPLLVLGAGLIFLAVYLVFAYQFQKAHHREHSFSHMETVGTRLSIVIPTLLMNVGENNEVLDAEMESLLALPTKTAGAIVNGSGVILHATYPHWRGTVLSESTISAPEDLVIGTTRTPLIDTVGSNGAHRILGVFPLFPAEQGLIADETGPAYLLLNVTRSEKFRDVSQAILSQALLMGGLLAVVTGFLWFLLHLVVILPLNRLKTRASAIASGDFSVHGNVESGKELAEVAAALDAMAAVSRDNSEAHAMHSRLYSLIEELVDEVIVCRVDDFSIISANRSAQQKLGYSAEEIVTLKPWDFMDGYSCESMVHFLEPLLDGSLSHIECESRHICKDGSTYPVRARMQYMGSQTPPLLISISQDLTELRSHQESTELLERAMATIGEGVIITDAGTEQRVIVYVNQALCHMSGFSAAELLGNTTDKLRKSEDNQPVLKKIVEALKNSESVQVQMNATRKNGDHYVTEVSMSPVFNKEGALTHYIGIHRDITQRLITEEKLHQSQKMKAIGHLSGGLAHDFNNLLSVIVGNLELLRTNCTNDIQKSRIEGAENAAHMGAHLTRRLLSFASQQRLTPVVTNVNEHVRNAVALLKPTIGETVSLTEQLSPDLWNTMADPGEIETAVINLTINARDAMSQGGSITIQSANVVLTEEPVLSEPDVKPGEYVRLQVIDDGSGISPELQEHIFEPFFSTKKDREGSGLGLASVFGFARQSGGYLSVSSTEGKGTTFSIYLPRHVDEEADDGHVGGDGDGDIPVLRKARILVVEDKDMLRALTLEQLQTLGFETLEVENGVRAIELLKTNVELDLVLSDIVMPGGVSGYEVVEWVREHRPDCRILLTSGFNEPASEHEIERDLEGVQTLWKPYRMNDLRNALHDVLGSCEEA